MKTSFKVVSVLLIVLLAGCAMFQGAGKPSYPTSLTDEMKQAFSAAEQNYFNKNFSDAFKEYQAYISSYGYNELTDEARFKLGEISYMNKRYNEALGYYKESFENLYNPQIAPKAQLKAAMSLYNMKRYDQALGILDGMKRKDMGNLVALRSDSLAINAGNALRKNRDDMIKWYLFLLDDYEVIVPSEYEGKVSEKLVDRDVAQKEVSEWVRDANVTESSVEALPMKEMKGKPSGGYVTYKLALIKQANGDFDEAAKLFKQYVNSYPKNEYVANASNLLAELKGKTTGKRYKIGVILPLSGNFSRYGNWSLHGIQCAAGLNPPCSSPYNIELLVKDTGSDPARTEVAVEEIVKEGALAIIGPLTSSTAMSAAKKAEELKIPIVSLAQKEGVTGEGQYVFQHALTPQDQVDTLVTYAVEKRKKKRFGIMYPSNRYGSHFSNMFASAVKAAGASVVFQKRYSHSELKGPSSGVEMDGSEVISGSYTDGTSPDFEVPSSIDALFIPDSYKAVKYVVKALYESNEKLPSGLLLLGVNRWNNPGLVSGDGGSLSGSVFVDGFFNQSADVTTRNFVQNFAHAFGAEPTILEAQGFDALKIIMAGINGGGTTRQKLASSMRKVKNLGGATGSISIDENGNSHRKLFLLTVQRGTITEVVGNKGAAKKSDDDESKRTASKQNSMTKYGEGDGKELSVRTDDAKYDTPEPESKNLE